jgi:hypothetical protein
LAITFAAASPISAAPQPGWKTCNSIESCIEAMRKETAINGGSSYQERFPEFGEAAVPPLMELLAGDDPKMRAYAAQVLWYFDALDPKYLPMLLREDAEGSQGYSWASDGGRGWLVHVIGRTGTDEAIAYLFDRMAENPDGGIHNDAGPALQRNKAKILPELRRRLENFPADGKPAYLNNLVQLANGDGPPFGWDMPEWVEPALVKIAERPDAASTGAAYQLQRFKHPAALRAMLSDFAELMKMLPVPNKAAFMAGDDWHPLNESDYKYGVLEFADFGDKAAEAGPLILPLLSRADMYDTRAAAAYALGQIGYSQAIPDLIALAPAGEDDWLLAYNIAESLGRLKAAEARLLLTRMATDHWNEAVRNNARRALNMIDGGKFELPGSGIDNDLSADLRADSSEEDEIYFGSLRHGDDREGGSGRFSNCFENERDEPLRISQAPLKALPWPGKGYVEIEGKGLSRADLPPLSKKVERQLGRGDLTLVDESKIGTFIGTAAGEFIGSLSFIDRRGKVHEVLRENVRLSFRQGGRLFVLTGLSHMMMSEGDLWEIDESGAVPFAKRRIRLPSDFYGVRITDSKVVVIDTREGDVALDSNGQLIAPGSDAACAAKEYTD